MERDMKRVGKFNAYELLSNKTLIKACGYSDDDIDRPIIGIANSFNDLVPGHKNLRRLAENVKNGIYRAGGTPVEFGVVAVCDGVSDNHEGAKYTLPSRDVIADSVEVQARAHAFDGIVLLGSCDKIVPGMLMAAARLDIPAIFVPGGAMISSPPFGNKKKADTTTVSEGMGMHQTGQLSYKELQTLTSKCSLACGSCQFMGTANTMSCFAESIGMTVTGGGIIPAVYHERSRSAFKSGEKIVELVSRGITARQIMTEESLENAIMVLMATGGSTNAVIHACALGYELGIDPQKVLAYFDKYADMVPLIAKIDPASIEYDAEDLYKSGGIPEVEKMLEDMLYRDVMTVEGRSLGENLKEFKNIYGVRNPEVIRTRDNPHSRLGGLAIMRGNIAPDSGVAKPAAISEEARIFTGKAICFDGEDDAIEAIMNKEIKPGHVLVIRYEGPKGGPGMREMYLTLKMLNGQGLASSTAVITDGRFSGTNNGCFVGHISPEAAAGGPIALLKDGDEITIDVINKKITANVSEEEFEVRRALWTYQPKEYNGFMGRYMKLVHSAADGAILK